MLALSLVVLTAVVAMPVTVLVGKKKELSGLRSTKLLAEAERFLCIYLCEEPFSLMKTKPHGVRSCLDQTPSLEISQSRHVVDR